MSTAFLPPPRWSPGDLEREVAAAMDSFRDEREREPLDQYLAHVDDYLDAAEELIELTVDLTQLRARALEVATSEHLLETLRFAAGPPISTDDLRVIARTSLAPGRLRATVSVADGRTYAGGLTKFEPREMERLCIPDPFAVVAAG